MTITKIQCFGESVSQDLVYKLSLFSLSAGWYIGIPGAVGVLVCFLLIVSTYFSRKIPLHNTMKYAYQRRKHFNMTCLFLSSSFTSKKDHLFFLVICTCESVRSLMADYANFSSKLLIASSTSPAGWPASDNFAGEGAIMILS